MDARHIDELLLGIAKHLYHCFTLLIAIRVGKVLTIITIYMTLLDGYKWCSMLSYKDLKSVVAMASD